MGEVKVKTYQERAAESCEWCAKGFARFHMGPTHHWIPRSEFARSEVVLCAAPTRDQYEQELRDLIVNAATEPVEWEYCLAWKFHRIIRSGVKIIRPQPPFLPRTAWVERRRKAGEWERFEVEG